MGGLVFKKFVFEVVKWGVVVVDNMSVFWMDLKILLVVFEVNFEVLKFYYGIVVNLNCLII